MKKRVIAVSALALASVAVLAGCRSHDAAGSGKAKTDLKAAIVTDTGGVNDRSFNQSAWEGLQSWGKENNLKKGTGYTYFQSNSASDYTTNYNSAEQQGYKLLFGIGFSLQDATSAAAKNNPKSNFVIVDSVIKDQKNVASATFADNESAYLAGVAAAKATKTNKIGFIGGMQSDVITRFEKGYEAGAKSVNPDIKVDVQYAGSFSDAAKGKTIAAAMYGAGDDVVYQCAGGVGTGVFSEAKALNSTKNEADKVWVIGVDRDQNADGAYTAKDGKSNFTLTSSVKKVGKAVVDVTEKAAKDKFPGGEHLVYGLDDKGVAVTRGHMSAATWDAVQAAKKQIIDGKVEVPAK